MEKTNSQDFRILKLGFYVAGTNELAISQQTDVFDYLSKLRMYNCIIASQEHYVIGQRFTRPINFNDVDTGMKLGVYTWFPYQSSDRCAEVNDITLLDSWVISAQGHFTKNTDLFPRKIGNNLNGCPMKAVARDGHWIFTAIYFNQTDSNGSFVKEVIGLEINLLRAVLQQLNMTFVHVPIPKGFELEIGSLNKLTISMMAKESYIALCEVGIQFYINRLNKTLTRCYTVQVLFLQTHSTCFGRQAPIIRSI